MAQNSSESITTIDHGLAQYPVKVDVQVKVHVDGEDHIFSGIGSAHRDDDYPYPYGGVVYKYNDVHIKLATPYDTKSHVHYDSGGIAYTGGISNLYHGPNHLSGPYVRGFARVRAWKEADMPDVLFSQTTNMSGGVSFLNNSNGPYESLGGVVYAFDDEMVRLWVPTLEGLYITNGGVFSANDGWLFGGRMLSGIVDIKAWNFGCQQQVFHHEIVLGKNIDHNGTFHFPCFYDITNHLVTVQIKALQNSGANGGMLFYGTGTTMASTQFGFGGVVYVYTENKVMVWRPSDTASKGNIINIGERWGNGNAHQSSETAVVIIRVIRLKPRGLISSGISVERSPYSCDAAFGHVFGDVIGTCTIHYRVECNLPYCERVCPVPPQGQNASFNEYDNHPGGVVSYQCLHGYIQIGGDVNRFCLKNLTWHGTSLICKAIQTIQMDDILNSIRINSKTTSKARRSKISIWEDRRSVWCIGYSGIAILALIMCSVVVPDCIRISKHLCDYYSLYRK
ncbi:Hypothetical predicted protein [Mytilus galloprovincialis]|uniref:Sushi domain-containing protein n=1 Tax=Mytilus galloprovincialis TaxID=29158 RepID=A0A8B6F8L1_MYTGA|nr:Hypothetical predicted protein [Mytilus galloprovincialis]